MSPLHKLAAALRKFPCVDQLRFATWPRRRARRENDHSAPISMEPLEGRILLASFSATNQARGATDPAVIKALAAEAYVWGLAPEFVQRFSKYNTILGAPFNQLEYNTTPAAWNDPATQAGDSSVLYINGFIDFNKTSALVLTAPPSRNQYYVANYLDDYINTIGSIGTRTTPSDVTTSYLLVGPNSPYAKLRTVKIHGHQYRVMASDTNFNWLLVRVSANSLIDASSPQSVPSVYANVVQKFALNTLGQFEKNGNKPVYPTPYITNDSVPTQEEVLKAKPYQNIPTASTRFFRQLGTSVKNSPIPLRYTALSGTSVNRLPAWVVPQYGAKNRYLAPSYGQKAILQAFAPLGLTKNGFRIPNNWGIAQLQALQAGYEEGQQDLDAFIATGGTTSSTNYWTILNTIIGTYPNTQQGYQIRSSIVLSGGSANIPLDAVYANMTSYMGTAQFDGNNTYSITFTPPASSSQALPVEGTYPPLVSDNRGNPMAFWSFTVYQPDPAEAAAPFLSQASVLNTHYSSADTAVLSMNATTDVMTVRAPAWGTIVESTPILFGPNASEYGLNSNTVYYVASTPIATVDPATSEAIYSFKISQQWVQTLSSDNVPIQNSGVPGAIVDLQPQAGASPLTYGMVKPVSQLGSDQLSAGQLAENADGSLTLWIGPTLPAGAPASNWIPTPSTAYFSTLYPGVSVSTALQVYLRMYYPTPGDEPPSVLPYNSGSTTLPESYIPPAVEQVS